MGNRAKSYSTSYLSGAVILIPSDGNRKELFIRNNGAATVYFAFNEAALSGQGIYLTTDDAMVLDGGRATAAIYCTNDAPSGGSIVADITPG
tara:strand:- start:293 stop:568 length:276 start_codon:yes stop_codon:yes gene_type:complete